MYIHIQFDEDWGVIFEYNIISRSILRLWLNVMILMYLPSLQLIGTGIVNSFCASVYPSSVFNRGPGKRMMPSDADELHTSEPMEPRTEKM